MACKSGKKTSSSKKSSKPTNKSTGRKYACGGKLKK